MAGEPEGVHGALGATVDFQVRRITTTEELEQSLGIGVEASYGCGAFGAGVSARFDFAKQSQVQASSLFMLVTCSVDLEYLSIKDPELDADADAAGDIDRPELFAARYGNMFVRGIGRGGLFVGVFRLDVRSERDREQISAALEGSYGLFSAEAEVNFSSVRSTYRCDALVRMYHEGGPVGLRIDDPTDPVQLLRNANSWLESFKADPGAVAKPYTATLAPMVIANGPMPPNAAELQHAQDVVVLCAKERSRLLDKLNLLTFVLDHPDAYTWDGDGQKTVLSKAVAAYQSDLDVVARCASAAINHPARAKSPVPFAQSEGTTYVNLPLPTLPVAQGGRADAGGSRSAPVHELGAVSARCDRSGTDSCL